ncbi:chorismate synthase [Candidatus Woesearchaeota archaeon]|nr:chorismate synthase [Candidatus Woesearchaeota archaeon]
MPGNSFGNLFKITTFGESHGPALGVVIDGCPPNIILNEADIQYELDKRKPGQSEVTTQRREEDSAHILSGVFQGKTTGTPIAILIYNKDADSSKYEPIKDIFRPGHADFTFFKKYGIRDYKGGGRSSARETAARVAAGAVAKKILEKEDIRITAYTKQVGKIKAENVNLNEIEKNPIRCPDKAAAKKIEKFILNMAKKGNSVGGMVECIITNAPAGLGEPVFDKLDADLSKAVMSIGATKGIEFGSGFDVIKKKGSENNDEMYIKNNKYAFKSNNAGGILGGISTGQNILFRVAIKPTPSIKKEQITVTEDKKEVFVNIEGRHDPCICPRIIPVIEAMTAIVLVDHLMRFKAQCK